MNKKKYHAVWLVFAFAAIIGALLLMFRITDNVRKEHAFSDKAIYVKAPALRACGDAFLFYNKEGAVLIDAGEEGDADLLMSAIEEAGVDKIDAMILTHYDKDHIGGAAAVLAQVPVENCYMTVGEEDNPEYDALMKGLAETETRQILLTDTETFDCMGASFTIYPPTSLKFDEDTDNNLSLITAITYGHSRLLFAGDAMDERMEQFYERQYDGTAFQFLKVPHHGRDKKLIARIMDYFSPEAALITSSDEEPEKESLVNVLKDQGAEVFLTREGPVELVIDHECIGIRQAQREYEILTDSDGKSESNSKASGGSKAEDGSKSADDSKADDVNKAENASSKDDKKITSKDDSKDSKKEARKVGSKEGSQGPETSAEDNLIINEIGNDGSHDGTWAELYNRSDKALSLSGCSLSDRKNKLFKYRFPKDLTVPSKSFLILYFNEEKKPEMEEDVESCLVDGFTLKRSESLYLASQGHVIDVMEAPLWLKEGLSYARIPDGATATDEKKGSQTQDNKTKDSQTQDKAAVPTPGRSNKGAEEKALVEAPVFSRQSGFYDKEFKLGISAKEGNKIYYTLDGSDPDEHSAEYKGEITVKDCSSQENVYSNRMDFAPYYYGYTNDLKPQVDGEWYCRYALPVGKVDKCNVIRAIAVDKEGNRSEISTGSYFVGYQKKEGYDRIAVMSLVSDPDGLFGSEQGILVNGKLYEDQLKSDNAQRLSNVYRARNYCNTFRGRGREWERRVHMDYFQAEDKELSFSQEAGLRLHGNTSRVGGSHKSFNLYSRKEYDGCKTFKASFYDTGLLSDKVTLMMGNDIRNYYFSKQMWTEEIPTQDYSMVQVFLDGEYWGIYAIQERYVSDAYMATHYNLDKEDYSLAKGNVTRYDIKNGNPYAVKSSFRVVRDFAQNQDLTKKENYEKLCQMMDMDSYIRSYAARLYTGDQDWSYFKNQIMLYADEKWHWLIYDMDSGAGDREISMPEVNTFVTPRINPRFSLANDELFPYLMKSPEFCARFTAVFMDMANGVFRADRVKEEMDDFKKQYGAAGLKDVLRNPQESDVVRENTAQSSSFTDTCDTIITYFSERYNYAPSYLADYFGLKGKMAEVTIHDSNRKMGSIRINTITPGTEGSENPNPPAELLWTGSYYTDYPVTISALPEEGYHFQRWEIEKGKGTIEDDKKADTKLTFKGDITVKAVFEKDPAQEK